jgi:hypothetical protein
MPCCDVTGLGYIREFIIRDVYKKPEKKKEDKESKDEPEKEGEEGKAEKEGKLSYSILWWSIDIFVRFTMSLSRPY